MTTRSLIQSFVVVGAFMGLSACAGLDISSTEQEVLPAPTNVTAVAISDTKITVSWNAVPGAFKYFITQSTSGGPFAFNGTVLAPGTSRTVINLVANTTYC